MFKLYPCGFTWRIADTLTDRGNLVLVPKSASHSRPNPNRVIRLNENANLPDGREEHEVEFWGNGNPDTGWNVWQNLRVCAQHGATLLGRLLRQETGLALPRYELLAVLLPSRDGFTMGGIARKLTVSNANVTAAVDALEKEGWVVRQPSARDRRQVIVCLPDPARRALEAIQEVHGRGVGELMGGLSTLELSLLAGLLGKLRAHLESERGWDSGSSRDSGQVHMGWGWI